MTLPPPESPIIKGRRARGHLGHLKRLFHDHPDVIRKVSDIERLVAETLDPGTLDAATDSRSASIRDPRHFTHNGRNLSQAGRVFIYGLFDLGLSVRTAAARIGISVSSAQAHRGTWLRRTRLN